MRFVDPTSACPALYVGCVGAFERSEPRSRMWRRRSISTKDACCSVFAGRFRRRS